METRIRNLVMATVVLCAIVCLPGMAGAAILNFDDIATPGANADGTAALPAGYGGFTWSASGDTNAQWAVIGNAQYRNAYTNTFDFTSNPNAILNNSGTTAGSGNGAPTTNISSASPFNFVGANFSAWTRNDTVNYYGATSLNISGSLGGTEVYNRNIALYPGGLAWTLLEMNNIDTLILTATAGTDGGYYFLMDNFTVTPTPIPGAAWLLGSGLVGLIGLRRRSRGQA